MSDELSGKVYAVTGGASGIGLALSKLLYARGASVSIADQNEKNLSSVKSAITGDSESNGASKVRFLSTALDVRRSADVDAWISETVLKLGPLSGAANLAGVTGTGMSRTTVDILDNDDWDFVMGVNCTGTMYCLRAELRSMKESKSQGSVVNAASVAGVMGFPTNAAYVASKHAVVGLTRSAAKEVGDFGIRVNAIAPGPIATPMIKDLEERTGVKGSFHSQLALKRDGKPEEVAELIAFLLSERSSYITGTVQSIDGGWNC